MKTIAANHPPRNLMRTLFHHAVLLLLVLTASAQPSPVPQPATREPEPVDVGTSDETKAARPAPHAKEAGAPKAPVRSSFQDRLRQLIGQEENTHAEEVALSNNYRIKVDYLSEGKSNSFSIVTARSKFQYQGIQKETLIDNAVLPSTIEFEGQLSAEGDAGITLNFFLGRTVPFVTGTTRFNGGKGGTSQYQQLQVGVTNGAIFRFGESLKVVESNGETITITIDRMAHP